MFGAANQIDLRHDGPHRIMLIEVLTAQVHAPRGLGVAHLHRDVKMTNVRIAMGGLGGCAPGRGLAAVTEVKAVFETAGQRR